MTIETSESPDRGWMGDPGRGAALGREPRQPDNPEKQVMVHLRAIQLNNQGYDPGGTYWGFGGWLWEAFTDDGEFYATGREYNRTAAMDRSAAKKQVLELLPNAAFYR